MRAPPAKLRLFGEKSGESVGPRDPSEDAYSYLARSGRPEAARVRALMEELFQKIPLPKRRELLGAFRSSDDRNHLGSALELICAGVLDRLGANLGAGHVPTGGTPDFLASWPDGSVLVECTAITEIAHCEQNGVLERQRLATELERVQNDEFYIAVRDWEGYPKLSPRLIPAMQEELRAWLDEKRHVDVTARLEVDSDPWAVRERVPCREFRRPDWSFRVFAVPKATRCVGSNDCVPFASLDERVRPMEEVRSHIKMRDDLSAKAKKYHSATVPLVLAATTHRWRVFDFDVRAALFGTHKLRIGARDSLPELYHARDGLWTRRAKPRFSHVAGVLVFNGAEPWTCGAGSVVLYENPWAPRDVLPTALRALSRVSVSSEGEVAVLPGPALPELLGLPLGWPATSP